MTTTTAPVVPDLTYTADGGARQGGADLWCTYAATRTLTWLAADPGGTAATAAYLVGCQNADGGFAWQRGLPSDVWATYYCTQALHDLGEAVPRRDELAGWLDTAQDPVGGFAMTPGQDADVWATYYATRTYREILDRPVPRRGDLTDWLAGLQGDDGGLGWYPGSPDADARAAYYGAVAHRAAAAATTEPPWDVPRLIGWLRDRQAPSGGFRFAPDAPEECLWATFRAVRALRALGAQPARREECADWVLGRHTPGSGFVRWTSYDTADVWACFSAVGALADLGVALPAPVRAATAAFVRSCRVPGGGFTYRDPDAAGDSLATSAAVLLGDASRVDWLRRAHLPYEDGVMYMPGRGAEIRCTLWAVAAMAAAGTEPLDADRLTRWLAHIQNLDGGFGLWHGRGSDMVATASAVEILAELGCDAGTAIDGAAARGYLASCRAVDGYRTAVDGTVTAAATAQALRALDQLGARAQAASELPMLDGFASRLGGSAATARGVPDLLSTYQVALTRQRLAGTAPDERRFLDRVRVNGGGWSWSILGRQPGGILARCLGDALAAPGDRPLPRLNL